MTAEFTGERVIPGRVDPDLWNEHFARYLFASRLGAGRRVLDAGCGTGYGSAELARAASSVTGVDISTDALDYARENFGPAFLRLAQASCTDLPFAAASFDLVTAFEVIEHLSDWPALLREARRVLAPNGVFVVSTPNRSFYAETRQNSGPNPFHEHEFEFDEFKNALQDVFPAVTLYTQDHTAAIVFRSLTHQGGAEASIEHASAPPEHSNFFIAVCAAEHQAARETLVYVPSAANLLKERLDHIRRLEGELATKDRWLSDSQKAHADLVRLHEEQKKELERSNRWAEDLDAQFKRAQHRIVELQDELAAAQQASEAHIGELNRLLEERTAWARSNEQQLEAKGQELATCAALLQEAESTVQERTRWAQRLDVEREELSKQLTLVQASRWIRMGRLIGLGPELRSR
jgi:SAM-dependent methyltransferase